MKNRVPLYPGRVTLTPVAGQANTYDLVRADQPTQVGTQLSAATLLSDTTAALLGGDGNMVPNDAWLAVLGRINAEWKLLWSRETAGSGMWVVPDINAGKPYIVGALIIGGGGSGVAYRVTGTNGSQFASGGASGCSVSLAFVVTPGSTLPYVVGSRGYGYLASAGGLSSSGGSSSLNTVVAAGGAGGILWAGDTTASPDIQVGGQPFSTCYKSEAPNPFGGAEVYRTNSVAVASNPNPLMCFNPFTNRRILGSGGGVLAAYSSQKYMVPGIDPITGSGGGHAAYAFNAGANGGSATLPGCGGGACFIRQNMGTYDGYAGSGADGAIYIYARGVLA